MPGDDLMAAAVKGVEDKQVQGWTELPVATPVSSVVNFLDF